MRILRYALVAVLAVAAGAFTVVAPSQATAPQYYLALGDSLSKGYQPGLGDTNQGYVNDLYATLQAANPALQLVQLGCSGETTGTMISGGICTYPQGSQLNAAVAFLTTHPGQVKYLTLDIGANDVDGCANGGSIDPVCVAQGLGTIGKDLTTILPALTAADGREPVSVGMTYYDPFLAEYLGSTTGKLVAVASVPLAASLNTELGAAFAANGFRVADVAGQFQTANFLGSQSVPPYGTLPTNVADICKWTYMCSVSNIHANPTGYSVIAGVFAGVIR